MGLEQLHSATASLADWVNYQEEVRNEFKL